MAYTLEVDHPDFPKGFEFDCDGILVENGSSKKLSKEDELNFISRWGRPVKDFYGHGSIAKVSGSSELSAKEKAEAMPEDVSTQPEAIEDALEGNVDEKDGGE